MDTKDLEKRVNKMGGITYWKENVLVGRKCTKCGQDKEINQFGFDHKKKDGYKSQCKVCEKEYRKVNKERIKEYGKSYREANKEHIKEYKKEYRTNNPDCTKIWRRNNKERAKELKKRWNVKNPDYNKQYCKQYYENIKEDKQNEITNMLHQINPILKKLKIKGYGCIYKITGINNHVYIGQTIVSLEKRYNQINIIKGWINDRKDKTNQKFREELEEESNFSFDIIDYGICQYHLNKLEAYYINKYDSCNNGYNNNLGYYKSDDGLEEFQQILKENGLEFIDNKLQIKNTHQDR